MRRIPHRLLLDARASGGDAAATEAALAWFRAKSGHQADALNVHRRELPFGSRGLPGWKDVCVELLRSAREFDRHPGVVRMADDLAIEFLRLQADPKDPAETLAWGMDGTLITGARVPFSVFHAWSAEAMGRGLDLLECRTPPPSEQTCPSAAEGFRFGHVLPDPHAVPRLHLMFPLGRERIPVDAVVDEEDGMTVVWEDGGRSEIGIPHDVMLRAYREHGAVDIVSAAVGRATLSDRLRIDIRV